MTLLMNVIHDDFSLLVADKKANTKGPTTIQFGKITVNLEQGGSIIGFNKIFTNYKADLILGIAGDANQHKYLDDFNNSVTANDAISWIEKFIDSQVAFNNRIQFLENYSQKKNEVILSFYDDETSKFYSFIFTFNPCCKCMKLFQSVENNLVITPIGSGQQHFKKIFDQKSLDKLIAETHGRGDIQKVINWIIPIYKKVSEMDDCVSQSFDKWLATKDNPSFEQIC